MKQRPAKQSSPTRPRRGWNSDALKPLQILWRRWTGAVVPPPPSGVDADGDGPLMRAAAQHATLPSPCQRPPEALDEAADAPPDAPPDTPPDTPSPSTQPVGHPAVATRLAADTAADRLAGASGCGERLAITQAERDAVAGASDPAHRLLGTRVLVVDDNRINQKLLERWLEKQGAQVQCVGDGAAAVQAVHQQRPDLVLMDVSMPVMNGIDATIAIRASTRDDTPMDPYFSRLAIIGVSAHAMPGDREACRAAGMDDYFTKPVQRDVLLARIASMLLRDTRA